MAIRKKDGSIYKVQGPNWLMVHQSVWLNEDVELINFDKVDHVIVDKINNVQILRSLPKPEDDQPFEGNVHNAKALLDIRPEPVPLVKPPSPPPKPKDDGKPKSQFRLAMSNKVLLFVLPGQMQKKVDNFYGEVINQLQYGEPFKSEAVIAKSGDISLMFWTTVKDIGQHSIVFLPEQRRWWKVIKIEQDPTGDGMLYECVPSSLKPDFSAIG